MKFTILNRQGKKATLFSSLDLCSGPLFGAMVGSFLACYFDNKFITYGCIGGTLIGLFNILYRKSS